MRKLNLIVVFNSDLSKGLFCIRAKEPYKGKYNFVGGKVEESEITKSNIFSKEELKKKQMEFQENKDKKRKK